MSNDSRRDFLKKSGLLAGGFGLWQGLPASVRKALNIQPALGSTYKDAEHVVILMQENRSFDHCFGSLQGVRGFDDPRPIHLPNGNPVWLQTNKEGKIYTPFHLDIHDSKITWMGGLPHTWENQVDARNGGHYDKWLDAKRTGYAGFQDKPMTLGYYKRSDLPFNYALADAFTICDHYFCSSLTGTSPNRLYFWTGCLRKNADPNEPALVRNSEIDYDREADWETFPEILQQNGISWKIYQNEISLSNDMSGEAEFWLGNFTDNPLEWFSQYYVRRSKKYEAYVQKKLEGYRQIIESLEADAIQHPDDEEIKKKLNRTKRNLGEWEQELNRCQTELNMPLSADEEALHQRAFMTNENDPDAHHVEKVSYEDNGIHREMTVPKSDILANFRKDVSEGKLPTVSWLVAPQAFSDHPSAPWYGAWYVSEVFDILTKTPEIWKKTIFIITYDENDGYFDHVPPFVAPDYRNADSGKVSDSIKKLAAEYVTRYDEETLKKVSPRYVRESPIGLGYRVPTIIASPWSRGGYVNSQVFDHTSVLQFLETFLSQKTGKNIHNENITDWRRAVCGDLTSVFRPYNGETIHFPDTLNRNDFIQSIDEAKYKSDPSVPASLSEAEVQKYRSGGTFRYPFTQESGVRNANILPYDLDVKEKLLLEKGIYRLYFSSGKKVGAPFIVYSKLPYGKSSALGQNWNFTVAAGDVLTYDFPIADFVEGKLHIVIHGPNGFYREYVHFDIQNSNFKCTLTQNKASLSRDRTVLLQLENVSVSPLSAQITDNKGKNPIVLKTIQPRSIQKILIPLEKTYGWYDLTVYVDETKTQNRFAGCFQSKIKENKTEKMK